MKNEENKELFTESVAAGSRTYFFDVKEAKDGTKYLVISESRQSGSTYDHKRIMIFEEHLEAFAEAFQKTLLLLAEKHKAYDVGEIRHAYPKAYEHWTSDDDSLLETEYREGVSIAELAASFGRQPGAIRSRLSKLGLLR